MTNLVRNFSIENSSFNTTNLFSSLLLQYWYNIFHATYVYFPSMEEFDTFAGLIRDFLQKDLVQQIIIDIFPPKAN